MKILGIDFGLSKTGVAISEGRLAEPLGIIKTASLKSWVLNFCQKEKIDKIIMGVSEGKMAEKQRKIGEELARITSLPVEFQDETLTTKEALTKMKEIGGKAKKEDAVSAALILQNYLDKNV